MQVLAVFVLAYSLAAGIVSLRFGGPPLVGFTDYLVGFSSAILVVPVVFYARTIGRDDRSVLARLGESLRTARLYLTNAGLVELVLSVVLTALLMAAFNAFKFMLPQLHPFSWDARIESASRIVHGGRLAYEWLLPVFGSDLATRALDALYYGVWPVGLWAVFVWQVGGRRTTRHRYLLTFAAAWVVLGTVLAILFSSAGPAYYAHLYGGPNPYAALQRHLLEVHHRHPLMAIQIQDALWAAEKAGIASGGAGVSAMPSLHVAMAELCAIMGRQSGRKPLAYSLTTFSILTLLASIYLGAHYALDGYVSILGVHVLWRASGRILRKSPAPRRSIFAPSPGFVPTIPEPAPRSAAEVP
jgi:hypothetical protein